MPRGTQLLRFPFGWLSDFLVSEYLVRETVQPTIDIGIHHPEVLPFRQSFVMAAGNNVVFLPGLSRPAQLNGTVPRPVAKGARRWLSLSCFSNTALAAGDDYELSWQLDGVKTELAFVQGSTLSGAGVPVPLIRGSLAHGGAASEFWQGFHGAVYVPDPAMLFLRLLSQAGGEVLTISGTFLESDSREQPLPDMFA